MQPANAPSISKSHPEQKLQWPWSAAVKSRESSPKVVNVVMQNRGISD